MVDESFWKLKIKAYLHDPPEKAIILGQGEGHENIAKRYIQMLTGEENLPEVVKEADRIAAATTRPVLEKKEDEKITRPSITWVNDPLLINPLSGEHYDLKKYGGELKRWDLFDTGVENIKKYAQEAVNDELEKLKQKAGTDMRQLYFGLWRLLSDNLANNDKGGEARLGHLWRYLPADTRVPDHSIWDHISMTAALATALPNPSFLLFSIGPVQQFIATARRSQDLWIGSYLLSYLTWASIKTVVEKHGPDSIIFPSLAGQPLFDYWLKTSLNIDMKLPEVNALQIACFPNRFLALVPENEAKELGEKGRQAVYGAWRQICEFVKRSVEQKYGNELMQDNKWNELWQKQTEGYFETYWVALPWTWETKGASNVVGADAILCEYERLLGKSARLDEFQGVYKAFKENRPDFINVGTCYELLYDLTERVHGARKSIRDFRQCTEEGYKCTLCGEHEALHCEQSKYPDKSLEQAVRSFWSDLAKSILGYRVKPDGAERLCAVCAVKRLAVDYFRNEVFKETRFGQVFPSVSSIAVAPFQINVLERAKENNDFKIAIENFVGAMKNIDNERLFNAGCVTKAWRLACNHPTLGDTAKDFLHIDGDYLFMDNLSNIEKLEKELGIKISAAQLDTARAALKELLDLAADLDPPLIPSTYVAILHMDGDDMGKWLSGEMAPSLEDTIHAKVKATVADYIPVNSKRLMSPPLHTAISSALRDYALKFVRRVVEDWHAGTLIYAGGDDVLAILPKSEALAAAHDLRLLYSGNRGKWPCDMESNGGFVHVKSENVLYRMMGGTASLSGGIYIAHHSHSLQSAIQGARGMEALAKGWPGGKEGGKSKNALAVAAATRSGETRFAVLPFAEPQPDTAVKILETFYAEFAAGKLSPTIIAALSQEAEGLSSIIGTSDDLLNERIRYLFKRNIIRDKSQSEEGASKAIEAKATELSGLLQALVGMYQQHNYAKEHMPGQPANPFESALVVLRLALFLAREERS